MSKELVKVTFKKQWRGHDVGAIADLTEQRADELIEGGYCDEVKPETKRRVVAPTERTFKQPSGE